MMYGNDNIGCDTTKSNSVTTAYEYDPFGRLLYADPLPAYETAPQFMFSTKQYESHWQHYYYGYRYYSPDLGRWLSRDPLPLYTVKLYLFCRNNSIMRSDMLGLKDNCHIGIYVGHFGKRGTRTDRGPEKYQSDIADWAEQETSENPPSEAAGFVSCYADEYNKALQDRGRHIDDYPAMDSTTDSSTAAKHLTVMIAQAQSKTAPRLCNAPMCCKSVTLTVLCGGATSLGDPKKIMKKARLSTDNGDNTATYDCSTGKWDPEALTIESCEWDAGPDPNRPRPTAGR